MRTFARVVLLLLIIPLIGTVEMFAADWNDFLGPERNGKSQEKINIIPWGKNGAADCLAQGDWYELRGTYRSERTGVYFRAPRRYSAPYLHGKHYRQRALAV